MTYFELNQNLIVSGKAIASLMRANKVTIRDLAARLGVTLVRVRQVRAKGVQGNHVALDWFQGITGQTAGFDGWLFAKEA